MEPGKWAIQVATDSTLRSVLAEELRELVQAKISERPYGAELAATPKEAYRIVLNSRIAGHVYRVLQQGMARDAAGLYRVVSAVDWTAQFPVDATFAVSFTGGNKAIRNTLFGAQCVKDAIVDRFVARLGRRPSVNVESPDVLVHLHLTQKNLATVSVELSAGSLHRRGYRLEGGLAPLRENLAAAVLRRAQWPQVAAERGAFVDPMCGSGTLVIEAALMIRGLDVDQKRQRLGSPRWFGHDWQALEQVMAESALAAIEVPLVGMDIDPYQIEQARENAKRAGVADYVTFMVRDVRKPGRPSVLESAEKGLLVVNLPYGQRVSEQAALPALYEKAASNWLAAYQGWSAALLGPNDPVMRYLGLRAEKRFDFANGPLAVQLWRLRLDDKARPAPRGPDEFATRLIERAATMERSDSAQAFANRLKKNLRHLGRWSRREGVSCYRVYDADLPEYALAVDIYTDINGQRWINVQEYAAPSQIDPKLARQRLTEAMGVIAELLEVPTGKVFLRIRRRQRGSNQYQKLGQKHQYVKVREGAATLLVNFTDYLDTGLFLDHRLVRAKVAQLAKGGDLLNLFCYTGTASVLAACEGARSTTSVDMSGTYLNWAARNFRENGFDIGHAHQLIRADCLQWLKQATSQKKRYDVIFLDPPTFSSSKRMQGTLDIQRDHKSLIRQAMALLKASGVLIFSTNLRRFKLDPTLKADYVCNDLSLSTLPQDFSRNQRIRQVFEFKHAE